MSCDRLRAAAEEVLTMLAVGGHLSASDPAINALRAALAVEPNCREDASCKAEGGENS